MAWDREKEKKAGKAMTIGSCVFGIIFSIFWCIATVAIGAWFMLLFGIPFLGMMVYQLYICIQYSKEDKKKAPRKEAEPWDQPLRQSAPGQSGGEGKFCPYCGGNIQEGFEFCPKCGRRQP